MNPDIYSGIAIAASIETIFIQQDPLVLTAVLVIVTGLRPIQPRLNNHQILFLLILYLIPDFPVVPGSISSSVAESLAHKRSSS